MKLLEKVGLSLKPSLKNYTSQVSFANIFNKTSQFNFHNFNSFNSTTKLSAFQTTQNIQMNSLFKTSAFNFARALPDFYVRNSKDTNKSQRGIYHFKRPTSVLKKCFSMKHHLKRVNVNANKIKIFSKILNTNLHLYISTKALRLIKKYGGLDNYILKSSHRVISDSQLLLKLKKIMTDEDFVNKSDEWKKRQLSILGIKNRIVFDNKRQQKKRLRKYIPSVFFPSDTLRTDISSSLYPPEKFISRNEQMEIDRLITEIEICTDNEKKIQLQQKLKELSYDPLEATIRETLFLQPRRHSDIRNEFLRIQDKFNTKMKYIDLLKLSENMIKKVLEDKYKHYSEDYPEVQLILQQTEHQAKMKIQKRMAHLKLRGYSEKLGDTSYLLGERSNSFSPYTGKIGISTLYFNSKLKGNAFAKRQTRLEHAIKLRAQIKRRVKREAIIRQERLNQMKARRALK